MDSSYYGFDIPVKNGKDYYVKILLYNIAVASSEEGNININFLSPLYLLLYLHIYTSEYVRGGAFIVCPHL